MLMEILRLTPQLRALKAYPWVMEESDDGPHEIYGMKK